MAIDVKLTDQELVLLMTLCRLLGGRQFLCAMPKKLVYVRFSKSIGSANR